MTTTLPSPTETRTLFAVADDLQTYFDTLEYVEAQLAEPQLDEDREALDQQRAELVGKLSEIGAELATKTDSVAGVLRRLSAECDLIKAEETRLHDRRKSCERAEKWLREYVVAVMLKTGQKQLKTASNTLFLRGSDAVVIEDAAKLPPDVLQATVSLPYALWLKLLESADSPEVAVVSEAARVKTEPRLSEIKKQIKAGWPVEGADLALNLNLVLR